MEITCFLSKYRKRISFNYSKQKLLFDVNPDLFSSFAIDKGTYHLIDSLRKNNSIKYEKILDLGCGYGIIGIFLKKINPKSEIHCIDRDALAIEFTKHNAKLNNCPIKVYSSLDYQSIKDEFNLICCNYPAKAGINAFKKFIYNASTHLKSDGILAIVIVKELLKDFENILTDEIRVIKKFQSSGHYVFHLKFNKKIEFKKDPYTRNKVKYEIQNKKYELITAYNVPEFESPSFTTKAIIKLLCEIPKGLKICIANPLQGHLAIAAVHYLNPNQIILNSRDLLSLEYSKKNLIKNQFTKIKINHSTSMKSKADVLIWNLGNNIEPIQFEKQCQEIKKIYKYIIIGAQKSKINQLRRAIKPYKQAQEKNALAVLIKTIS
ncbi:methyltransferase [Candidatus Woesearchaeota archaeon]|nr:methyltransferase [Candidatus Woesearchaeota archaeon]